MIELSQDLEKVNRDPKAKFRIITSVMMAAVLAYLISIKGIGIHCTITSKELPSIFIKPFFASYVFIITIC